MVSLSLPWAGVLGKKTKYFLKEMEVGFWLPAGCLSPVADSAGLETRAGACSECLLCITVFQEFRDTGIFNQLCCLSLFSNLKLLIQRKSEWGASGGRGTPLNIFLSRRN